MVVDLACPPGTMLFAVFFPSLMDLDSVSKSIRAPDRPRMHSARLSEVMQHSEPGGVAQPCSTLHRHIFPIFSRSTALNPQGFVDDSAQELVHFGDDSLRRRSAPALLR